LRLRAESKIKLDLEPIRPQCLSPDSTTRMKTVFAFGKSGIEVSIPEIFASQIVRSRSAAALSDLEAVLGAALDHPIGCQPLAALAAGKRSAAISVCDITRPAPNWITLPPLLNRLHAAGIPIEGITLLIATGLHRGATQDEINSILGPEIAARYRVVSHDARALAEHRCLGTTLRETPVYIDERFMAAELHITLGFIEPHFMLGFSGGRKLIAPGLAAQQTIKTIHSPRFMREPMATEGSIAGNPLHAELLEIAALARHDFILDVTLTQDRQISGVFAGDAVKAHAAGVRFLEATSLVRLAEPADAVITSAAGYPLDLTFYQTLKGISAASHIARPGGRILLLGECAEGIGSPEFARKLQAYSGHASYLEVIRNSPVEVDQWQLEKLALAGLNHELYFFVPGVSPAQLGSLGAKAFDTLEQAVDAVLHGLPASARVALVPDGPYTFARAV
jgi:nickel-dependent lactate racemase